MAYIDEIGYDAIEDIASWIWGPKWKPDHEIIVLPDVEDMGRALVQYLMGVCSEYTADKTQRDYVLETWTFQGIPAPDKGIPGEWWVVVVFETAMDDDDA